MCVCVQMREWCKCVCVSGVCECVSSMRVYARVRVCARASARDRVRACVHIRSFQPNTFPLTPPTRND